MGKKKLFFAKQKKAANTFWYGMATRFPTLESFLDYTTLKESDISSYEIAGDDVQFYNKTPYYFKDGLALDTNLIGAKDDYIYALGANGWRRCTNARIALVPNLTILHPSYFQETKITSYENHVANGTVGNYCFFKTYNLKRLELPYVIRFNISVVNSTTSIETCYVPRCKYFGSDTEVDYVFNNINPSVIIYIDPYAMTANGGSPNPDIQYAIDRGCDVRPVTDFTVPNTPNTPTLISNNITSLDISWTTPSSTTPIDYYNIYLNGVFNKKIYGLSANIITEAGSNYDITVEAVDNFYNKSEQSNPLNVIT